MSFVDEVTIHISAGTGGDGVERWRHEKFKEFGGPSGGNGGRGGNVYARGVHDLNALHRYKQVTELSADRGESGGSNSKHGAAGADLIVDVPRGSVITNKDTGETFRIEKEGEQVMILEGGAGGLGNEHFKSSRNTRPRETTAGEAGEEADVLIEVELFADFGLIGLPSAGKSSLLNELTNAKSKTGAYHFTTLEPHLGDMHGFVVADIPGLIEGASEGRGLGHRFLRHIKRTRLLVHCVSLENDDVAGAYRTVRHELEEYGSALTEKEEVVVLTKRDEVNDETFQQKKKEIEPLNPDIYTVSILDDQSVKDLHDVLIKRVREE